MSEFRRTDTVDMYILYTGYRPMQSRGFQGIAYHYYSTGRRRYLYHYQVRTHDYCTYSIYSIAIYSIYILYVQTYHTAYTTYSFCKVRVLNCGRIRTNLFFPLTCRGAMTSLCSRVFEGDLITRAPTVRKTHLIKSSHSIFFFLSSLLHQRTSRDIQTFSHS
jgi:hypothetical protein